METMNDQPKLSRAASGRFSPGTSANPQGRPKSNPTLTMSSLQIAEITGKDHKNILGDIQRILDEAGIGALEFKLTYTDSQNKQRPCYNLPRRECDLVIFGYSVKYRLAIIDRWQELEAKQLFNIPQTLPEALRLAAVLAEKNETLLIENEEM